MTKAAPAASAASAYASAVAGLPLGVATALAAASVLPGTLAHRIARVPLDSLTTLGIVLGLELSRLSRSNKDWHQLIDVCGIFQTLLGDQDGVYDPVDSNDRLLLGLAEFKSPFAYDGVPLTPLEA